MGTQRAGALARKHPPTTKGAKPGAVAWAWAGDWAAIGQ